ncbi:MAG: hypothetical protein KBE27_00130 [Syntrophorhabdaceae bacterium]|nr:hypothetical protein [Syntrophorhabdales bacterium]MBP9560207.1 hypothetical protein [Syntrophorhabdaceae bacterium]
MAIVWDIEKDKIDSKTMEGAIIEIFGCAPIKDTVITLFTGKDKIKSDFYVNGNFYEAGIIEVFGCISLDKIIKLDLEREKAYATDMALEELDVRVVGID